MHAWLTLFPLGVGPVFLHELYERDTIVACLKLNLSTHVHLLILFPLLQAGNDFYMYIKAFDGHQSVSILNDNDLSHTQQLSNNLLTPLFGVDHRPKLKYSFASHRQPRVRQWCSRLD